jgi:two-component system chemotaxis response regulator CheB
MLTGLLSSDPQIEVVGTASDPLIAREQIKALNPDVVTLDIEMPRMDGLEFLEKIMTLRPTPVLMISSLTQKGADATLRALELGAVDFVGKPTIDLQVGLADLKAEIIAKVKIAATAKMRPRRIPTDKPIAAIGGMYYASTDKIIAIGASTGGVEALAVLSALPADAPGILVTQHMPAQFTDSFARRLNGISAINISEASEGTRILPGHAYIAPGGQHLRLARSGGNFICRVDGTERASGHCPSVDVLFSSVAAVASHNAVGVILTGMGKDGAMGLLAMRKAGARTLGQDEASSVVYGMPRIAFEIGAVEAQASLDHIPRRLLDLCVQLRKEAAGARRA